MSPGADMIMRMCADTTEKQRAEALWVATEAMPNIKARFDEMGFFRLAAFCLRFVKQGRIPTQGELNTFTKFVNATEAPEAPN